MRVAGAGPSTRPAGGASRPRVLRPVPALLSHWVPSLLIPSVNGANRPMGQTVPLSVLGLIVAGDVGPLTVYTDRWGRKVSYPKAPPDCPPTAGQLDQRARFAEAMANWSALSFAEQQAWEQLVHAAGIAMTGHNLFVHFSLILDPPGLQTLQLQTGVDVVDPPYIPWPG